MTIIMQPLVGGGGVGGHGVGTWGGDRGWGHGVGTGGGDMGCDIL